MPVQSNGLGASQMCAILMVIRCPTQNAGTTRPAGSARFSALRVGQLVSEGISLGAPRGTLSDWNFSDTVSSGQPPVELGLSHHPPRTPAGPFALPLPAHYRARVMVAPRLGHARLALIMVGLPARGKTSVARKLQRYLSWLGYRTFCVNVGDYRRALAGARQPAEFFNPNNPQTRERRESFATAALEDLLTWFDNGGEVGIYDATNTEKQRRQRLHDECIAVGVHPVFVETICTDESVIERNVRENKLLSPDYEGMAPEDAVADFKRRIDNYALTYEPVDEPGQSYVKLIDAGRQVVINRMQGYLCSRLVLFLMNIYPAQRPIWLTRHGESAFNVLGRIGGDAPLTHRGREYAQKLAGFLESRIGETRQVLVLTSTMRRTLETAAALEVPITQWRALDEIDAGVCDGMTYEEVKEKMPEEYEARNADKFRYRYPRGESYADVVQRLEAVLIEIERARRPVLVIGHQAVLRALYGYFVGKPQGECPHLDVPLHTVIQLTPTESGFAEERFSLLD